MDPIKNPYTPGAGTQPTELAGRDTLLEHSRVAIARIRDGRPAKSLLMVGLRGVGKTVLLDRMLFEAQAKNIITVRIEATEGRSLPAMLAPELRVALLRLSHIERAKDLVMRARRGLAGFVRSIRVKYEDVEVALDVEPEPGLADNADLNHDLQALFEVLGEAAKAAGTAIALFIDELQYVPESQLEPLIGALHRCAQRSLPLTLVGAGLPQLRAQTGDAKSYAERLFEFPEIGPLLEDDARSVIVNPAREQGVEYERQAVDFIVEQTGGYPYFLQEWGKQCWDIAQDSPIPLAVAQMASEQAIATLDASFFRVRFDRMAPAEKMYVRAMAELGPGPHRSGDIATILGKRVNSLGPVRARLISKGMVWSPSHGDTAFTVPLFDGFMKRIMPGDDWR